MKLSDRTSYEAQVRAIDARLKFAELRLTQFSQLQEYGTGRAFDVEERQAEVDQLRAQLDGARWNLEKTRVRAPADGYVTNLALRKGARVTARSPVMGVETVLQAIATGQAQPTNLRFRRLKSNRPHSSCASGSMIEQLWNAYQPEALAELRCCERRP